jgi:hypothetical protein
VVDTLMAVTPGLQTGINAVAQFLTLCSASNLAEAQHISSPLQGSSPAKTWASSTPSRAYTYCMSRRNFLGGRQLRIR